MWGLPPGWKVVSMHGSIMHYINQMESLRSDTKPEEIPLNPQVRPLPLVFKMRTQRIRHSTSSLSSSSSPILLFSHQPKLPKGWEAMVTSNGDVYYKDHNTRTVTWTKPPPQPDSEQRRPSTTSVVQQV